MKTDKELLDIAIEARNRSYAPYSHYRVGAALMTKDGKVYTGCNIENAAYTPSNCAERTAIFKAVSEGDKDFEAIAIAGGPEGEGPVFCAPCGVCRQVLNEFCTGDLRIILCTGKTPTGYGIKVMTLDNLLPESFGPSNLTITLNSENNHP